ncbi:enoyl-CoA hydratase-related protein [Sphingomonas jeddahensis]|uniref:1,2-epoxyphenylacetyl-CoA isomerase n=1 Tax=Sphingomonas jeddahensis TaxID=1915074 RepID=A0A1V2EVJ8_9SPHN|nr:enoyl-CoA hydratase-related protein [Sphingomonas jeddahensis]ONF96573.1 1,2-epoxyphenylacetyl-CoA isomerase [Sphingomonas jeddahensis]
MTFEQIRYTIDGPIATIMLARPDKLNAYTAVMGAELAEAVRKAGAEEKVRAIILTGEGRGFCAGADISGGADSFSGAGPNFAAEGKPRQDGGGFVGALFDSPKPIIAAINGAAVGVGATLTLPCDIRIAADSARFGFVFARRGLVPEAGSAWFLPQLVGLPQALRWCLSGKLFDAAEALQGGLVSEVVASDDLIARAQEIAREIAENTAPVSIALTRQMLWRFAGEASPAAALKVDGGFAMTLGSGPDVREGVAAFLEKRAPAFPGKIPEDMPPGYPWWGANAAIG